MAEGTANGVSARKEKKTFELIGGSVALDLVNTLDWRFREEPPPEELLKDYYDLAQFSTQSGLMSEALARRLIRSVSEGKAARVVDAVRELREAAAQVLYAALEGGTPSGTSVKLLERYFREARESQHLIWDGEKLAWELSQSSVQSRLGGAAAVDACAEHGRSADIRRDAHAAGVWKCRVPVAFSRYQQEPYAAVVRYEDLREPDEGAAIQGATSGLTAPSNAES